MLSIYTMAQQQDNSPEYIGVLSGKIHSNFNFMLNTPNHHTAFELTRAYFGYEKQISKHLYAQVKLDVGSPDDVSEFSRVRRYAYFKNAGITWKKGNLTAWGGLFDMVQFKEQEEFWGYRFLYRSFLDEYRFGPSADIGAGARYQISPTLKTDLVISNGEGYSSPQRDDTYKAGWGITFLPSNKIILRSYYSIFMVTDPQMTFSGFAGFRTEKFRTGAEYNHQLNYRYNPGRNRFGYSLYSTWVFTEAWEFFLRYDQVYSNLLENTTIPWNLPNDGSAVVAGIQYSPLSSLHITIDYQDWVEYAGNGATEKVIFIHLEAIF